MDTPTGSNATRSPMLTSGTLDHSACAKNVRPSSSTIRKCHRGPLQRPTLLDSAMPGMWTLPRRIRQRHHSRKTDSRFIRCLDSLSRPTLTSGRDDEGSPRYALGLAGASLAGCRLEALPLRLEADVGCSLPTVSMRLTHDTLGKARAVVFGIVFAIVLIAYALHRLHP